MQVYFEFGLDRLIRDQLFTSPEFCSARATSRDTTEAGYYGCADAHRINEETQGKLFNTNNSIYELAIDWGQVYTFAKWSSGLLMAR